MHDDRKLVPIGTEIECYASWLDENDNGGMPIFTGGPEDAFGTLTPGMYPGSYMAPATGADAKLVESVVQVNVIVIVTPDESFAVTTIQSYTGPVEFEPFV